MRRRIVVVALVAATVVAVAELGARALESRLPDPRTWHSYEAQVKADEMEAIGAFTAVDVAFVGSSTMDTDLDPVRLRDEHGIVSYNAALGQAAPRVLEPWVREVVLPRLRPETLVVGLSSFDLTDPGESRADQLEEFVEAPGFERLRDDRSPIESVDDALGDALALWRLRTVLRDPGTVLDAAAGLDTTPADVRVVGPGGMATVFLDGTYGDRPAGPEAVLARQLADYEVGGPDVEALRDLVGAAREHGAAVVFVVMPVTPAFLSLHEDPGDYERFRAGLDALAAELGVDVVDLDAAPALDDTDLFADAVHLNRDGARVFTDRIADALGS